MICAKIKKKKKKKKEKKKNGGGFNEFDNTWKKIDG